MSANPTDKEEGKRGATLTKRQAISAAREEIDRWNLPRGQVMAILWAFIHYAFNGETIEETFFHQKQQEPEYYI